MVALLVAGPAWAQEQTRSWLGVNLQEVTTEDAANLGWQTPRGTRLARPLKGSPAEAAGLVPGDVITALDGVELRNTEALTKLLEDRGPGTVVRLRLLRAGAEMTVPVKLEALPEDYALLGQATKVGRAGKFREGFALVQQALALAEKRIGLDDESVAEFVLRMAQFHDALRNPAAAEPLYKRALSIREKALGPDHPDVAKVLNGLSFSYERAGRHDEAEALYRRSVAMLERAPAPDAVLMANTLAAFSSLYLTQKLPAKAEPLRQRSIAVLETSLGREHPELARLLDKLALSDQGARRYAEAEALYRRSLAILEKAPQPDDVQISETLGDLAWLYEIQKLNAKAEPLYRRSLAVLENVRGADHLDVRGPLEKLASFYMTKGSYREAGQLRRRALAITETALGADHPEVGDRLSLLAGVIGLQERHAETEPLLKRRLAILEKALGPEHPDLAEPLRSMARLYDRLERHDETEQLYRRVLAIVEKALGPEHRDSVQELSQLGYFYKRRRRFAEAEQIFLRALAVTEKAGESKQADTARQIQLGNLLDLYRTQHRYGEMEELQLRRLASLQKVHGPEHPDMVEPLDSLASLYDTYMQRRDKAEPLYERALAIVEKTRGADHPEVLSRLGRLADLYERQRRHKDAEPLRKRALAIKERTHGPDHPDLLQELARNYEAQRRYEEAEQLYQRALATVEKLRGPDHPEVRAPLAKLASFYGGRRQAAAEAQRGRDKTEEQKSRAKAEEQSFYAKMEPLYQRGLAIAEKAFGPDDPQQVGEELRRLAGFYKDQARHAEAEPLYRRWLAITEKARGPDHPDLRWPLTWLAMSYEHQDKPAEALPYRERGLAVAKKARGAAHGDVSSAVSALASLYAKLGQDDKAEALRKTWLAEVEKVRPADHADLLSPLNELASSYSSAHRYAEAEPLHKRILAIADKTEGPDSYRSERALSDLAGLYVRLGRYADAEPLYQRELAQAEKKSGGNDSHQSIIHALGHLVTVYRGQSRYAEAVPLARRVLAKAEKNRADGEDPVGWTLVHKRTEFITLLREANLVAEAEKLAHTAVASAQDDYVKSNALLDLADLYRHTNRLADAETTYRQGLERAEASDKKYDSIDDSSPTVRARNALALLLHDTGRLAEAEALFQKLRPGAKSVGAVSPTFATTFGNHASLLSTMGRHEEALDLGRRALEIDETFYGPDHPSVALELNRLGALLWRAGRLADAEPLLHRSLAIRERVFGADHAIVASSLNTLGLVLEGTGRAAEAESLYRRAIAIREKTPGGDHPALAAPLNNLALLTYRTGRPDEAEALMRRALFINKSTFGPRDSSVAMNLVHLALMRARHGDWAQAAALHAHAKPALLAAGGGSADDRPDLTRAMLRRNSNWLRQHAAALNRANARGDAARTEGFELAQWALQTDAAEALTQMSARFAKGDGQLASLVREREGLVSGRRGEEERIQEAIGKADAKALKDLYASRYESGKRLEKIDAELAAKFSEYASLANPKPLTVAETQALLRPDEALVLFLDGPQFSAEMQLPDETLAWVVTRTKVSWHRVALNTRALTNDVVALRCGLDDSRWSADKARDACRSALKGTPGAEDFDPAGSGLLPFDLARAHALYKALLGPAENAIKGKHLLIVPSGPLTSLPFGVLVTEPPKGGKAPATLADYRKAAWLGTRQPVSVLPSVASLGALRRYARASQAAAPFVGFGNPALAGDSRCPPVALPDSCPDEGVRVADSGQTLVRGVRGPSGIAGFFRGGLADVTQLRSACPLPDTAYELRCVARSLGAAPETVVLGKDMTETAVKAAPLDRYRIVHFATHGLLAGETAQFAKDRAEPALLMSPPASATEADDGLLTASEVAGLKLDADWVVLSACNTAGGREPGAEALSGLARAFFYAGARALLVSHWYVDSYAATMLTSRTFAEMRGGTAVGRAEAFRRAMVALVNDDAHPWNAHPSRWAPFVVVGEGAAVQPQPAAEKPARARAASAPKPRAGASP
jgi:CHAT domain-containing protein/Flp pilus assembly protein TadD